MHSRQPGFTYCTRGSFTKKKKKDRENFKKQLIQDDDPKFKIQDKACFQLNMGDRI